MPRKLTPPEVTAFENRHPDLVIEMDALDNVTEDTVNVVSRDLVYPRAGRAVADDGGYVLVWRDPSARWQFIDISDQPGTEVEINKPEFHSPEESFFYNVGQELDKTLDQIPKLPDVASWAMWLVGGAIVLMVVGEVRKVRG